MFLTKILILSGLEFLCLLQILKEYFKPIDRWIFLGKIKIMHGTLIGGSNNIFSVECDDGAIRQCSIKGKKLKSDKRYYNPLAPGDILEIDAGVQDGTGQITALLPRKNVFERWNVKGRAPQLLAANLDYIVCFTTPDFPPFRPRFVDRMLVQAEASKIEPLIVCNKCDLEFSPDTEEMLSIWEELGYKVFRVSAKTGEGLAQLACLLNGKKSAFAGQSGVGKSSVINALDMNVCLKTGNLSQKYERGTHTTTRGTLYHLQINPELLGGASGAVADIIDTPGIRRFVLNGIPSGDLIYYFREMEPIAGTCSFGLSCTHSHEAGCRILEAVHAGVITEQRYESWQRIKSEIETGSWED